MTSDSGHSFGVRRRVGDSAIQAVVDPRMVPPALVRLRTDQLAGARYVTVKRADVEGTFRFVVKAKDDELVDLSACMLWQVRYKAMT